MEVRQMKVKVLYLYIYIYHDYYNYYDIMMYKIVVLLSE